MPGENQTTRTPKEVGVLVSAGVHDGKTGQERPEGCDHAESAPLLEPAGEGYKARCLICWAYGPERDDPEAAREALLARGNGTEVGKAREMREKAAEVLVRSQEGFHGVKERL